jgi:NitT/TauT family transport system substrate-binding protein
MAPKLQVFKTATQDGSETMKIHGASMSVGLCLAASSALAADKVSYGTNWLAEAEHGGYYQALVDGTYAKYGLDVTIVQGGPQANNELLLAAGKLDFYMGGNLLLAFDAVARNVPIVVVAADFQKDPQIFMSHPGVGLDKWTDLPKADAVFVGKEGLVSFYQWMESAYGFKEENVKPYTFNPGPFIADPHSIQQGYVTSEPFAVEREGHFKPNIFLLADYGYGTYATTIETRADLIANHPDVVQRFVEASAIGWYHYLYGDNAKANVEIKKNNPDMTDEQIAFSIAKIKEYGLADSGDTLKLGIGAMTDDRVKNFFESMVKAGVEKADLDYKKAYTLQFVDKGVGVDLRPK